MNPDETPGIVLTGAETGVGGASEMTAGEVAGDTIAAAGAFIGKTIDYGVELGPLIAGLAAVALLVVTIIKGNTDKRQHTESMEAEKNRHEESMTALKELIRRTSPPQAGPAE